MIVVGLTGGIASGKTTVAHMLRRLGAAVVDADEIAREVTAPGTPALEEIVKAFGPQMVTDQGTLDRKRLGSYVFSRPRARRRLEEITHPRIMVEMRRRLERLRAGARPPRVAVAVIPLLFEAGAEGEVDTVVAVTAPPDLQEQRLRERGLTRDQARRRIAAQLPAAEKARRADAVIDTSGTLEETARQVEKLWHALARGADE